MLTIKHIHTDGAETLFEAETVEVVRKGDRFEDGIYFDREKRNHSPDAGEEIIHAQVQRPARHCIPFVDARATNDTNPVVYVMNRFGSTVATYHL